MCETYKIIPNTKSSIYGHFIYRMTSDDYSDKPHPRNNIETIFYHV